MAIRTVSVGFPCVAFRPDLRMSRSLSSGVPVNPTLDRVLAALLRNEAKVSEQRVNGNTALHSAFLELGVSLVVIDIVMRKYLQETTRNLTNVDGLSILHIACTRPYLDVVARLLLNEKVNVHCKVNKGSTLIYSGYTPLHFAVKFNQREIVEILITRYHAHLYEQNASGWTPLHLALELGNFAVVDLLLAHDRGHDNVVNDRGLPHFMSACAGSNGLVVEEYLRATTPATQMINATVNRVPDHRFAGYNPLRFAVEFNAARLPMDGAARETTLSNFSDYPDGGLAGDVPWSRSESRKSCQSMLCSFFSSVMVMIVITFFLFWGFIYFSNRSISLRDILGT